MTGKERGKRINKKPLHKGFSTASWEDRLTDNEKEDDGNITDPELIAEKEYAVENAKFADNVKKNAMISTKIKQAKADRKARGRGVSGSMCKKEKGISYGGFHTLMDMDVYYGLDNDEYDTYMSDTDEPFNSHEEGIARQEKEKANQSEADLIEDMNQMFLNDDDEEEDDDRPGPSRLYYRTGDGGKPKRLYRM
uniref:Bm8564, isoform b n=1 Tax=Brugia malayi TaxID=6279 RepID=A0A1U7EZZ2_BRUMA|nr:Bm8564, isoform b [Brugia malayi]